MSIVGWITGYGCDHDFRLDHKAMGWNPGWTFLGGAGGALQKQWPCVIWMPNHMSFAIEMAFMVTLKMSIHSPLYIPINQEFTNPMGKSHLRFWCLGEHVWSNAKGSRDEMSVFMPVFYCLGPHSGWSRSSLFDDVWWTRSNPNLIPIYHNLSRLIGLL